MTKVKMLESGLPADWEEKMTMAALKSLIEEYKFLDALCRMRKIMSPNPWPEIPDGEGIIQEAN